MAPHAPCHRPPPLHRLDAMGRDVGLRLVELLWLRHKADKREIDVTKALQFLSNVVWPALFHRPADGLQASGEHADQCECSAHW